MEELRNFPTDLDYHSPYFQDSMETDILWSFPSECLEICIPDGDPPIRQRTAFARYRGDNGPIWPDQSAREENIHKRLIGFFKSAANSSPGTDLTARSGRCYQHKIRERQRRVKLGQSYSDLHAMLPPGSKASKNAIVQIAAAYVRRLEGSKAELRRRNDELMTMLRERNERAETAKIRVCVSNPSSKIDSMIGALRCLKGMNVGARTVRARFDGAELAATIDVQTKVRLIYHVVLV
ncbi:hypothetical protein QJS04_geneDACA013135 [Acorus gramineus]|uniref:BHLH domain-containing protein n=1 Tax=Acorus gramineus TaxID=55184 RepID=A0AAV9B6P5_ACOGR|nr:hypothetical protein QJS04_geneDACA013135 [Acorus gramineus]